MATIVANATKRRSTEIKAKRRKGPPELKPLVTLTEECVGKCDYFATFYSNPTKASLLPVSRPCGQKYNLSATTLTPTSPHNGSDDGQKRATGDGSYHLAEDGAEIKASQGRDEGLEDFCANNTTYCSGDRVSGA